MKSEHDQRIQGKSDFENLIKLARRFAPPDYTYDAPISATDLSDLRWRWGALFEAIKFVLPCDHTLWSTAAAAVEDDGVMIELWKDVAQLPERDLQCMIDYASENSRPSLTLNEPALDPSCVWD